MIKRMPKNKKDDDLDMETTFVDMNVEGFKWYDPTRKRKDGMHRVNRKVGRKEFWQLVRGAYAAMLPMFIILILTMGIIIAIAYIWLH